MFNTNENKNLTKEIRILLDENLDNGDSINVVETPYTTIKVIKENDVLKEVHEPSIIRVPYSERQEAISKIMENDLLDDNYSTNVEKVTDNISVEKGKICKVIVTSSEF